MKPGGTSRQSICFKDSSGNPKYIHPDNILMIRSFDHWIYASVEFKKSIYEVCRHCSLGDILLVLEDEDFKQVNKFYILNTRRLTSISEADKSVTFDMNITINLEHKILKSAIKAFVK
jgi:hypothetical protein